MFEELDFVKLLICCDHYAEQFQKELSQQDLEVASYILTEYEYLFDLWHIKHYEDVVDYISLAPHQRRDYKTQLPYPSLHLIKYVAYTTWPSIKNDVLVAYCLSDEDKALVKVHHAMNRFPYKLRLLHFHKFVTFVSPEE